MSGDHLICNELAKEYGERFSLGPISLELGTGVTCLVGANGAGKSTFFRLAAGVDRPTAGTIALAARGGRTGLGYLPQEPLFPGAATCEDFLLYVAWLQRVPSARRSTAVTEALSAVELTDRRTSRIRTLSGGMRRRLGIAHALVHDPLLLLLDEPTVGLDPNQRLGLRHSIDAISEHRIVLVSTHLVEDVRGLADRVIVLHEGSVVYDGDVPGLERQAASDAPGDSDLERAIASMIAGASA